MERLPDQIAYDILNTLKEEAYKKGAVLKLHGQAYIAWTTIRFQICGTMARREKGGVLRWIPTFL